GQWWWDTDTTEIPLGQQVEFRVTSEDVNHGLGIYNDEMRLLVQVQAMPNYTNSIVYTFDEPGTYQILCMEFCGIAHHDMTYEFEVLEASS
ncbi:MAG: cytochrome C oxidase subunit I, partial [Cognatishimia sp.]|nr:cytochrome C oxidase subunit I [Cognatishimia sp.]